MPTGRKPTQHQLDTLVNAVRGGNYLNVAAPLAGLHESTWYAWQKEADTPECRDWVAEVVESVRMAQAEIQARMVQTVRKAGEHDPKYALEFLQRTRQKDWSLTHKHEMDVQHRLAPADPHAELAAALAELEAPGVIEATVVDDEDDDDEEPERVAS